MSEAGEAHLVPGIHGNADQAVGLLDRGDTSPHLWRASVGEKIRKKAFLSPGGIVLTIDGQLPGFARFDQTNLKNMWEHLPASPEDLHESQSVRLVLGDSSFARLPYALFPDREPPSELLTAARELDRNQELNAQSALQTGIDSIVAGGATAAIFGTRLASERRHTPKHAADTREGKAKQLSRRGFLGKALAIVGSAAVPPIAEQVLGAAAAVLPQGKVQELLQKLDSAIPQYLSQTFSDGRTAIMSAKRDAVRDLDRDENKEAAFIDVLGYGHNKTYDNLQDKNARPHAIRDYAKMMIEAGKRMYATVYPHQEMPAAIINNILDYISLIDYIKVTSPKSKYDPFFKNSLKEYVTPLASFRCKEILDATADLRMPSVLASK